MPLVDTSVVKTRTTSSTPAALASNQNVPTNNLDKLRAGVFSTTKNINAIGQQLGVSNRTLNSINDTARSVVSIANSIKSVSSVFGLDKSRLAKSIDSIIGNVFDDTNIKKASTTTTKISDPTATNLTAPKSSGFLLTSLEAGSKTQSPKDSSSKFGSLSDLMTGTNISTVLDRYNLTSENTLNITLNNEAFENNKKGLFSDLSKISNFVNKATVAVSRVSNLVTATRATVSNVINSSNGSNSRINAVSSRNPISLFNNQNTADRPLLKLASIANDVSAFVGTVDNLSTALGGADLSNFYISGSRNTPTLMNQSGGLVSTRGYDIDSVTANSILGVARNSGCNVGSENFSSYQNRASLFNVALTSAAQNGLDDLVDSLLNCSMATTSLGAQAINNSFISTVASNIETGLTILDRVVNKSSLNTPSLRESIITNPSLKASDVPTISAIMVSLGTTSTGALSVPGAGVGPYQVLDLSIIDKSKRPVINGIMEDSVINDFLNGSDMSLLPNGTLTLV